MSRRVRIPEHDLVEIDRLGHPVLTGQHVISSDGNVASRPWTAGACGTVRSRLSRGRDALRQLMDMPARTRMPDRFAEAA
jgi:hypothetical protein